MKTKNAWLRLICLLLVMLFVVTALAGCQGEAGPQGPAGEKGEAGADGKDGAAGLPGINGNVWTVGAGTPTASAASGDLYLDTTTGNVWRNDGSAWSQIACIKGNNGVGTPGESGNTWTVGAVVPTAAANAGDMYLNTATNDVYQYNGNAWTLVTNINGQNGVGTPGAPGTPGKDGNVWTVGAGMPSGTANVGDMYLNTLTNDVYQYGSSGWAPVSNIQGAAGTGLPGTNGSKWYTDAGVPTTVNGAVDGDLYLDLTTGDLYKLTTTWVKIGCIKGEDGANGTDGSSWTVGNGAPAATAKNGDLYYDQTSGKVYQYQTNAWVEISKPLTEKDKQLQELLTLKKELRAHEDGSFKVLMFSDIHYYSPQDFLNYGSDALKNINDTVDRENPDLVLFAGDNWWDITSEEEMRGYLDVLVGHIEEKKIPWAHVYGNHDDENQPDGWTKSIHQSVQQRICEEFEYCVSKAGEEYLSGTGNYVLPVLSHDGTKILYNIWALDSGSYAHYLSSGNLTDEFTDANAQKHTTTFYSKYEGIQRNQVDWYVKTSQLLEEYNGEKIPAMMYFHIPLQETYTAWKSAYLYGVNGTNRTNKQYNNMEIIGTKSPDEGICAPTYNAGLFDAAVERGDVKLMAYGHDHIHDFSVVYQGINLCYIPAITTREGVTGANNPLMGGRVIELGKNFNTYMAYVDGTTTIDPEAPILDLDIAANGAVTNGVVGPRLTFHDFSAQGGGTASVVMDSTLGCNVLSFDGNVNFPSVYNLKLPKLKYTSLLADGFSYEVTFKANAFPSSGYVGILDMEEAGGFGLNLYPNGKLYAETKLGSAWDKWIYTIEKDTWYHCVYVFDGTNTALYINGVMVTTDNATHNASSGSYVEPTFENRSGQEYVCIGACAQAWSQQTSGLTSNGEKGFNGYIAEVKLLPTVLTQAEITALYQASGVAPAT